MASGKSKGPASQIFGFLVAVVFVGFCLAWWESGAYQAETVEAGFIVLVDRLLEFGGGLFEVFHKHLPQ